MKCIKLLHVNTNAVCILLNVEGSMGSQFLVEDAMIVYFNP
jgi:hypothetical protein